MPSTRMRFRMMAVVLVACFATAPFSTALADAVAQKQVRELEQAQARAAIARDRPALEKIFSPDFRVISPDGTVSDRATLFALLLGPAPAYASAVYETEQIRDFGDVIVTIGLEKVVPAQGAQAGQTVRRRTTQVWRKRGATWVLELRQANIVP